MKINETPDPLIEKALDEFAAKYGLTRTPRITTPQSAVNLAPTPRTDSGEPASQSDVVSRPPDDKPQRLPFQAETD